MDWPMLQEERKLLPDLLTATGRYTTEATEFEAEGVKENRLQNLAVTLHKIAFFLRHQQPERRKVMPCLWTIASNQLQAPI